jgi:hypothetical protein
MTLALDQPIRAAEIMDVRELKDGKVFLLTGRDGSKLVIKAEDHVTGDNIKATASVVKAIDPTVKMKPLVRSEVDELSTFVRDWEAFVKHLKELMKTDLEPVTQEEKQSIAELKNVIAKYGSASAGGRTNIAKLSYVQMTTLGIVLNLEGKALNDKDWDEGRETFAKFIKALNKSGGLEKMGQIMAGDFFIGNQDRFSTTGGVGIKLYSSTEFHRLKVILNLSNMILVKEGKGKSTRPSMLDYMDPFTDFMNIDQTLGTMNRAGEWPMHKLLRRESRLKIAQDLVDDLEYILKPEQKRFFSMNKIGGSRAASRVNDGVIQGIRKIVKSAEARRTKLPPLMQSYLDAVKAAKL